MFNEIPKEEIEPLLGCLEASREEFARGEYILRQGQDGRRVGVVLRGGVNILSEDYWGNRVILSHISPGGLFGEAFACAGIGELPVSAAAASDSEILFINYERIVGTCATACGRHTKLVRNMLVILARKNIILTRKIEHTNKRTIRAKVMSYLSQLAADSGSPRIRLPFDRQELADFLSVDRSALSRELGNMRDEGLIRFTGSKFELLQPEDYS